MQIRIPKTPRWFGRYLDWINRPIYTKNKIEIRRIDVALALGFVGCVSYYWIMSGWQGAVLGGAMYVMALMMALWLI